MIPFFSRHGTLVLLLFIALAAALLGLGGLAGDTRTPKAIAHLGEWIKRLAP